MGWQYGIRSEVLLAAMVAAILAASKMSPFGDLPSLINFDVKGDILTTACAVASRNVSDLSATSNIPPSAHITSFTTSHLLTEGNTPSFHAAAPESDISFFHIGVIVFMLSIVYRHASKASCRCSVDIAIATLISLTLRLPILCIAINFFTCHFFNT